MKNKRKRTVVGMLEAVMLLATSITAFVGSMITAYIYSASVINCF